MESLERIKMSLAYDTNRLIKLDLKAFGIEMSQVYFYLDYLNHPFFSGNKIRKLYGSLKILVSHDYDYLLTIGGNYSNYLYACSFIPELFQKKFIPAIGQKKFSAQISKELIFCRQRKEISSILNSKKAKIYLFLQIQLFMTN